MKKALSLFIVLMSFIFSSCVWNIHEFFGDYEEESYEDSAIKFDINPEKKEYKTGDVVYLELTGALWFKYRNKYEFNVYLVEGGKHYTHNSRLKFEVVNTDTEYNINDNNEINFILREKDCQEFEKLDQTDRFYKLNIAIPIKFLKETENTSYFIAEVNCSLESDGLTGTKKSSSAFTVLPADNGGE